MKAAGCRFYFVSVTQLAAGALDPPSRIPAQQASNGQHD
jgi:hypothetical protein